jgi:hypothetical protein
MVEGKIRAASSVVALVSVGLLLSAGAAFAQSAIQSGKPSLAPVASGLVHTQCPTGQAHVTNESGTCTVSVPPTYCARGYTAQQVPDSYNIRVWQCVAGPTAQ